MTTMKIVPCVSLMLILVQLGCGGPGERDSWLTDDPVELETIDPQGQEVTFWYQHSRERETELLALIGEFNRTNPHGIRVRGEYAGGYNDIYNKMVVAIQSGTVPDLLVAYQNQARAYYQAEGIVDLSPYMESERWGLTQEELDDFYPAFLQQDRYGDAQICFPPNRSLEVLYYNKDWLAEMGFEGPPSTWQEFATMCRAARDNPFSKSPRPSRSLGFMLDIDASRIASMVFGRAGDLYCPEEQRYTLDTEEMRTTLRLMLELMREGAVEIVGDDHGDQAEFSVGQVLFTLRSSSGLPFYRSAVEQDGVGFRWNVTNPPYSGDQPVVNVYGASLAVGRTNPSRQLAAWIFLKWFTQPEQQARWVTASNYFPVRKSTAVKLDELFERSPQYRSAYQLLQYGKSEPAAAGYQQVRRLIQNSVVAILDGENMDRVLRQLEERANRTLLDELY